MTKGDNFRNQLVQELQLWPHRKVSKTTTKVKTQALILFQEILNKTKLSTTARPASMKDIAKPWLPIVPMQKLHLSQPHVHKQ